MPQKAKNFNFLNIVTQNARGLKNNLRIHEISTQILKQKLFAICLQETWRNGDDMFTDSDCTFILHGIDRKDDTSRRGKGGVGIVLSKSARDAWNSAGSKTYTTYGSRIIAVRLLVKDNSKKDCYLYLISAYAPIGVADQQVWDSFLTNLQSCINAKPERDILLIGCDTNSSLGTNEITRNTSSMSSVGKFGISHRNASGIRFSSFLETNCLVACSTYFQKSNYSTWCHPRSKLPHQIDHIIIEKSDFFRVIDAHSSKPLLDSDHLAVKCKLRVVAYLKQNIPNIRPLTKLDSNQLLQNDNLSSTFNETVKENIRNTDNVSYETLAKSIHEAALTILQKKSRATPDWFTNNKVELLSLIQKRNDAVFAKVNRSTRGNTNRARLSRNNLKKAIHRAKSEWISNLCQKINSPNNRQRGTAGFWDGIKLIKRGLDKPPPSAHIMMTKEDGSKCKTQEENAEVFHKHFQKLYNREATFDPTVLDLLDQSPVDHSTGIEPTLEDIKKSIQHLRNNAPGESGITAQMLKCIAKDNLCLQYLHEIIISIWNTDSHPIEWDVGRLVVLPKKGNLHLPGNYRGIMLLEISYKICRIIIHQRLQPLIENLDHENQFAKGEAAQTPFIP